VSHSQHSLDPIRRVEVSALLLDMSEHLLDKGLVVNGRRPHRTGDLFRRERQRRADVSPETRRKKGKVRKGEENARGTSLHTRCSGPP
jgi:hypothetical protein